MKQKRNLHPNGIVKPKQSRLANIKCATCAVAPDRVVALVLNLCRDASIVYAIHNEIGKVEHAHYVVRFPQTLRWTTLAQSLRDADGHEYAEPGKSWRRGVRYCLHLDNPEKAVIPRDSLRCVNVDESELSQLLGSARLPILQSLALAESLPLSQRFSFLVCERGHAPSEVSSALRCMMELERWSDSRTGREMRQLQSAMPSVADVDSGSLPFPDDSESLLSDDVNPFPEDV